MLKRYRQMSRESFGFKVFNAFALSVLIVSVAFTLFFIYYQRGAVKEDLMNKGKMFAGLLAYSSRAGVFAENRDLLKDAVRGVMDQEEVLAVAIYADDNIPIMEERKAPSESVREDIPGPKKISSLEVVERSDRIDFLKPVVIERSPIEEEALFVDVGKVRMTETVIGYVRVTLDKAIIARRIRTILLRNAVIASAFIFFGSIIIYVSLRRVTRPLVSLAEGVRSVGAGESAKRIPVESEDEIGKLAGAFNAMIGDLRSREEEKRSLEERLRLSEKMEALGRFARGIAHDFNNILTTVHGSLFILRKRTEADSSLSYYTDQLHNSVSKMKSLIQGLLAFSKRQTIRLYPTDINGIIGKLRPMLAGLAGDKVELDLNLSEDPLIVTADALQIEQVLMNLCTNARDAMPEGGVFAIKTESVGVDEEGSRRLVLKPGMYVHISVSDNGVGMDESTKEKMFEPFFTTKEDGRGIGLGLSIVFGIIDQHGGRIHVDSEKGGGTIFEIYLPLLEKNGENVENREGSPGTTDDKT